MYLPLPVSKILTVCNFDALGSLMSQESRSYLKQLKRDTNHHLGEANTMDRRLELSKCQSMVELVISFLQRCPKRLLSLKVTEYVVVKFLNR